MEKHIVFGQVFADTSAKENIEGRIFSSPEGREAFYEREAKKLPPALREKISQFLRVTYGVTQVRFTFSRKAGCAMCPCSPGWSVSGKLPATSWGGLNVSMPSFGGHVGHLEALPIRERLNFFAEGNGRVSVRGHRKEWAGRRDHNFTSTEIAMIA